MTIESLKGQRVSSLSDRPLVDREGEHEWVETYKIPNDELEAAKEHLVVGRENILPGHEKTDIYAPCVTFVQLQAGEEFPEHHIATVLFRRPSPRLILEPGRAILSLETYTTTIKREYGQLHKRKEAAAGTFSMTWEPIFEIKVGLEAQERVALVITAADWATHLNVIAERARQWRAKGGELTIYGKEWKNLKCSRTQIRPRSTNAGILDSTWTFIQNDDGWPTEGIIEETWICFDSNGNELEFDIETEEPVNPPVARAWHARKLFVQTSDVISGEADFSALEDYFKWMTTGG